MNLQIEYCTNSSSQLVPLASRMLTQRRIFLDGAITSQTVSDVYQQLFYLITEDPNEKISLYINSPGGSVDAGLQIIDLVHKCQTPVVTYCIGSAANTAALIFAAGQNGRYMSEHAELMLFPQLRKSDFAKEEGSIPLKVPESAAACSHSIGFVQPTVPTEHNILADILPVFDQCMDPSTANKEEIIQSDKTYTAEEAIQLGLCDAYTTNEIFKEVR